MDVAQRDAVSIPGRAYPLNDGFGTGDNAMTGQAPPLREMLAGLIAAPSVSSSRPQLDQSNLPVIEALAPWLEGAGFAVEVMPVPGHPASWISALQLAY